MVLTQNGRSSRIWKHTPEGGWAISHKSDEKQNANKKMF